ncbi:MAG: hypothetical protein HYT16_04175 [DPANN group archaeon]|nr:hypothetical protein [DPANN group archaeon]
MVRPRIDKRPTLEATLHEGAKEGDSLRERMIKDLARMLAEHAGIPVEEMEAVLRDPRPGSDAYDRLVREGPVFESPTYGQTYMPRDWRRDTVSGVWYYRDERGKWRPEAQLLNRAQ